MKELCLPTDKTLRTLMFFMKNLVREGKSLSAKCKVFQFYENEMNFSKRRMLLVLTLFDGYLLLHLQAEGDLMQANEVKGMIFQSWIKFQVFEQILP